MHQDFKFLTPYWSFSTVMTAVKGLRYWLIKCTELDRHQFVQDTGVEGELSMTLIGSCIAIDPVVDILLLFCLLFCFCCCCFFLFFLQFLLFFLFLFCFTSLLLLLLLLFVGECFLCVALVLAVWFCCCCCLFFVSFLFILYMVLLLLFAALDIYGDSVS